MGPAAISKNRSIQRLPSVAKGAQAPKLAAGFR